MDILEFLKAQGFEVEKPEEFKTEFFKNFKSVGEVSSKEKKLEKVNQELEEVTTQLETKGKEFEELTKKLSEVEESSKNKIGELEQSLSSYKLKDIILSKGIKNEHSDYVLYRLGKMEGDDIDANLEEIIEANQFLKEDTKKVKTIPEGEGGKSTQSFNELVRGALKK